MTSLSKTADISRIGNRRGISRFVFILLILLLVMIIVVSIPLVMYYRSQSKKIGCYAALDTARRQMADKYLIDGFKNAEEVKEWVGFVMNGWDDLCPGGGKIFVVPDKDSEMPWRLVCGMHGDDKKECCRLNASWVLDQVRQAVKTAADNNEPLPEKIPLKLNGETLEVMLTEVESGLRRGTSITSGYSGTVAFYGVSGNGEIGTNTEAKPGEVCYLSFADPDYCANWKYKSDWSGTAFK